MECVVSRRGTCGVGSVAVALVLCASVTVAAESALPRRVEALHTSVELVADCSAVVPGAPLWLGVRFVLEPGWHVYWLNPGDSGNAPTFDWRLPAGFSAGATEWPVPERIEVSSLVNYGYHGEVVLASEIHVPSRLDADGMVALGANVKWLVCQDLCVSGQATLELALPVQASSKPSSEAKLIADARERVPPKAPASWRASATSESTSFVVSVETGKPEREGIFFPLELSQIDDSAPQRVTPLERGLCFTLRKSNRLIKLPASLNGVVRFPDGRAFVVAAPLAQTAIGGRSLR